MHRDKTKDRDRGEEQDEDDEGGPVDRHRAASLSLAAVDEQMYEQDHPGADPDPQQLVPVKEWNACPGRLGLVVTRHPDHRDVRDDQQQIPKPRAGPARAIALHRFLHNTDALNAHRYLRLNAERSVSFRYGQ
jgi:hypothetical protein